MLSRHSYPISTVLLAMSLSGSASYAQAVVSAEPSVAAAAAGGKSGRVAADVSQTVGAGSQFALGVADVIRVNVWKSADLTQTVTVGPDGFVSLPLLGDVHAAGLTASQLARDLTQKLSSYVVNAQVTVSVVDIRSRQVFVTGQVGKPGAYPLIAPITVLQLIAEAGGLTTFAD